jgi:thiamine biosynthesis lipoprotein
MAPTPTHLWRALALPIVAAITLAGCAPQLQRAEYTRVIMGVEARIVLFAPSEDNARSAANAAFARLAELDAVMSDYRHDGELMQLCRAPAGEPVAVSDDLFNVIAVAQRISHSSGGAFDITIGPLVSLWRQARETHALPSADELSRSRQRTGYQHIELHHDACTVTLKVPGVQLDLGGIGKGYAAQQAIDTLRSHDINSALIALAGDIVVSDAPPNEEGWRITIDHGSDAHNRGDEVADNSPSLDGGGWGVGEAHLAKPQHSASVEHKQTLTLTNCAISTSGSNQQFIVINGTRYSHIIDPRTGLGLTTPTIVTVIAGGSNGGAIADALSSAACILGGELGETLVAQFPNCSAIFSSDEPAPHIADN